MRSRDATTLAVVAATLVTPFLIPRVEAALVEDASGCPGSGDMPSPQTIERDRESILCLLNRERARRGVPPLRRNPILELASQRHSEDMAARDYFAHDAPDGVDLRSRLSAAGWGLAGPAGENLYWGEDVEGTPVRALHGWMHSPGHREALLSPQFTEVGVGIAHDAPQGGAVRRAAVYTTDFGGPGLSR